MNNLKTVDTAQSGLLVMNEITLTDDSKVYDVSITNPAGKDTVVISCINEEAAQVLFLTLKNEGDYLFYA